MRVAKVGSLPTVEAGLSEIGGVIGKPPNGCWGFGEIGWVTVVWGELNGLGKIAGTEGVGPPNGGWVGDMVGLWNAGGTGGTG